MHHFVYYFYSAPAGSLADFLITLIGWSLTLLPMFIVSVKHGKFIHRVIMLNILFILIGELLAWIGARNYGWINESILIALFIVNAIVFWFAALIWALRNR